MICASDPCHNVKFRRNLGMQRDDVTLCRLSDGCEASVLAQVLLLARIYADALTADITE